MPKRRCKSCEIYASFFPNSLLAKGSEFCVCGLGLPLKACQKEKDSPLPELVHRSSACPQCCQSLEDVSLKKRLGCSHCYIVFEGYLKDYLAKLHKSCQHLGKVPRHGLSPKALEAKLQELSAELDRLVAAERFQDASLVKHAIKTFTATLETLLNNSKKASS